MYQFHQEQHFYTLQQEEEKLKANPSSWVMTTPEQEGFVKLPHERILHKSPPRTSLDITSSKNPYPGAQPFTAKSEGGTVYVTNQRVCCINLVLYACLTSTQVVFLPSTPTQELQSFSAPLLNLQDTYVRAPFFGANYWTASCKPVAGGGIPTQHGIVELKLTFKEGGAFDFHQVFEQIKERVHHAQSMARDSGRPLDVDLEQLPAYEPVRDAETSSGPQIVAPVPVRPQRTGSVSQASNSGPAPPPVGPDELPPGYEEAQASPVNAASLDERLRDEAHRQ
jgi:hypothetical protein